MKYNKEYIEQLLKRFMDGETTEQEELFLTEYFSQSDSIPEEWEAYRELFASFATDAYDFSEEELLPPKTHIMKMWPWLAAACVAALLVVFLAPPRENVSLNSKADVMAETKKDSLPMEQQPEPITSPYKQTAQVTERKVSAMQEQSTVSSVPKKKSATVSQETTSQEPAASVSTDLAMEDVQHSIPHTGDSYSLPTGEDRGGAEWDEVIEQEFRTSTVPIRMRGQQVMQRVAMIQEAHRNQTQHVEM